MRPLLKFLLPTVVSLTSFAAVAQDFRQPSPTQAKLYFIEPREGAEVAGPVAVKFGLAGMGVAPAGTEKKDTGHHHLLINQRFVDPMQPLPMDDKHRHFGGGQTETVITLPPGRHTLQLILGDHNHIPHNPMVASEVITITVK